MISGPAFWTMHTVNYYMICNKNVRQNYLVQQNEYRITLNKRPGRLLNFSDFMRGVYLRGRLLKNLRNDTQKKLFS